MEEQNNLEKTAPAEEIETPAPQKKKINKNLWIILGIVLIAGALILISKVFMPPSNTVDPDALGVTAPPAEETPAGYVLVVVNNQPYALEPLGEERDLVVEQPTGEKNIIHLLPNGYYMAYSSCDNQLCVHEGTVTLENYQRRILGPDVLCLPNMVWVELLVPSQTPAPDAPDI